MSGLDIIGDIHGYADHLHRLLTLMDYREIDGTYTHPDRRVMFLGDFIDRGPDQPEVLRLVRRMCEKGSAMAVMGNHEFNAIGWATEKGDGHFLRSHDAVHRQQHQEFLDQIGDGSPAHHEAIEWFLQLPVYREYMGQRFVHACWHQPSIDLLSSEGLDKFGRFTVAGFEGAHRRHTPLAAAAEVVLKGPEQKLPDKISFKDKSGHVRTVARIKWWDTAAAHSMQKALMDVEEVEASLPDHPIDFEHIYQEKVPVFFGHYWLKGEPEKSGDYTQCLDFSVAKGGYLTAYRWSGEDRIEQDRLVWC